MRQLFWFKTISCCLVDFPLWGMSKLKYRSKVKEPTPKKFMTKRSEYRKCLQNDTLNTIQSRPYQSVVLVKLSKGPLLASLGMNINDRADWLLIQINRSILTNNCCHIEWRALNIRWPLGSRYYWWASGSPEWLSLSVSFHLKKEESLRWSNSFQTKAWVQDKKIWYHSICRFASVKKTD